jgi:predicted membrane channel-forming protein YqfA (hemolysin III family)
MAPVRLEPSWRQPVGILLILLLIAGWAVLVASAAPLLAGAPRWLDVLYYLVAGIAWILPLKPLLRWMETGRWRG